MKLGPMLLVGGVPLFVAGCVSSAVMCKDRTYGDTRLPYLVGNAVVTREEVNTRSPIIIFNSWGRIFSPFSPNDLTNADFISMRETMKQYPTTPWPYCIVYCDKKQTVGALASRVLRELLPPREEGLVGLGLVVTRGNLLRKRLSVLNLSIFVENDLEASVRRMKEKNKNAILIRLDDAVAADDSGLRKKLDYYEAVGKTNKTNRLLVAIVDPELTVQQWVSVIGRNPVLQGAHFWPSEVASQQMTNEMTGTGAESATNAAPEK